MASERPLAQSDGLTAYLDHLVIDSTSITTVDQTSAGELPDEIGTSQRVWWSDIDSLSWGEEGLKILTASGDTYLLTLVGTKRNRLTAVMRERVMASIVVSVPGPDRSKIALRRESVTGSLFTRVTSPEPLSPESVEAAAKIAAQLYETAGQSPRNSRF